MKKYIVYVVALLVLVGGVGAFAWYAYGPVSDNESQHGDIKDTSAQKDKTAKDQKTETVTVPLTLYYVALEDNGTAGERIGCNDSLVADTTEPVATTNELLDAMKRLVGGTSQYIGQSGLYDSLYSSDLTVKEATVSNDKATIVLTGELHLNGTCDSPRVKAQLEQTALAASHASKVDIILNGKPLDDALGMR